MGTGNYKDELRRVRIAFIFSLIGSVLCLIIIFNSINNSTSTGSRLTTSAIGFSFIVVMTTIVFVRLTKLLKHIKRRS